MKKMLFIYNPHAGKGQMGSKLSRIVDTLTKEGCLVTVYPTQRSGDAARVARELGAGYDRVVCCGGDGTLHEVVTGLMELSPGARPPVGYLPAGTTNDYARNLKLPRSLEDRAVLAASGEPRAVDVGRLGEQYFIYVAAFGAFINVAYDTPQQLKNTLGHLAYVLRGVSELGTLKGYPIRVEHDGGVLEGEYMLGMVSNTVSVGGIIGLPKEEVSLDDGILEALLIPLPKSVNQLNAIILALARQEYDEDSGVAVLHSSRYQITCAQQIPYTLDGEFGGEHSQAELAAGERPIQIVYGK